MCACGAFVACGFFHEEHQGDHAEEGDAHEPEVIDVGLHGGLALEHAVEQAVSLGGGLRGGRDLSELARTHRVGMETICQILKRAGRAVTNPSRCPLCEALILHRQN